jgi:hypothetical protein
VWEGERAGAEGVTRCLRPSVAGFLLQKARARGRRAPSFAVSLAGGAARGGGGGEPRSAARASRPAPPPGSRDRPHPGTTANPHATADTRPPPPPPPKPPQELDYLDGAVSQPKRPFVAIVGGSKVSSKITVIEALLEKVDKLIIG